MFLIKLFRHKARVLAINEALCRALYNSVSSLSADIFLPDLVGVTEILTEEYRKKLCLHLIPRLEGSRWSLAFTTSENGFNLKSLYQKMTGVEGPIILIIRDVDNNVFGALLSDAPKLSHHEHIYGTGECFLFKFSPDFKIFKWTGHNEYFIRAIGECVSIGGGDGRFGLWVDADLDRGRTQRCKTFNNEPLSTQEDFHIVTLECWAFV